MLPSLSNERCCSDPVCEERIRELEDDRRRLSLLASERLKLASERLNLISDLESEVARLKDDQAACELQRLNRVVYERTCYNTQLSRQLREADDELKKLGIRKIDLERKDKEIEQLEDKVAALKQLLEEAQSQHSKSPEEESDLLKKNEQIEMLQLGLSEAVDSVYKLGYEVYRLGYEVGDLHNEVAEYKKEIQKLRSDNAVLFEGLKFYQAEIARLTGE